MPDFDREIADRLNADPTIRALLADLMPRQPRYRYFEDAAGRMFLWTTEPMNDGRYASCVMSPYGPGARSGRRAVTRWRPTRETRHRTRRAAKARALALYYSHNPRQDPTP